MATKYHLTIVQNCHIQATQQRYNLSYCAWLYVFFILTTMACATVEIDTEIPTVQWPINFNTNDTLLLFSGDSLELAINFKDNQFLKEYILQINPIAANPYSPTLDTIITQPLTGQDFALYIKWPTDVAIHTGLHQIEVVCKDANEQASSAIHKIVRVQNSLDTQKPTLSLINPPTNPATVFGGSNLLLMATIADNNQLGTIMVQLYNANGQKLYQITPVSLLGSTQTNFNTLVPIPDAEGEYKILVHISDAVNNSHYYWLTLNVL